MLYAENKGHWVYLVCTWLAWSLIGPVRAHETSISCSGLDYSTHVNVVCCGKMRILVDNLINQRTTW